MSDPLVEKMRRQAYAVHLATEAGPAADLSDSLTKAADRIERMDAVVRAAREASYTDPTQHRATDWGAYLATFGQRLFLLREAVDVLDRSSQNRTSAIQNEEAK